MSTASPPVPASPFAGIIAACLAELCRIVCSAGHGTGRGHHPAIAPLAPLLVQRFQRLAARFRSLAARFDAGALRPPKPRVVRPADPASTSRPPDPLPRGDAWLLRRLMRPETERARCDLVAQTEIILAAIASPAGQSLIAAEPVRAGRLLRPLLLMTRGAAELPACLRLPPRPGRQGASLDPSLRAKRSNPGPPHAVRPPPPAPIPSRPDPPPPSQAPQGWRVVPVIRVVWPTPGVVRFRIRTIPRDRRG